MSPCELAHDPLLPTDLTKNPYIPHAITLNGNLDAVLSCWWQDVLFLVRTLHGRSIFFGWIQQQGYSFWHTQRTCVWTMRSWRSSFFNHTELMGITWRSGWCHFWSVFYWYVLTIFCMFLFLILNIWESIFFKVTKLHAFFWSWYYFWNHCHVIFHFYMLEKLSFGSRYIAIFETDASKVLLQLILGTLWSSMLPHHYH